MSEKTYGRDEIVALLDGSMSNLPRDIEERDSGLWLIAIDDDALRDLTDIERDALPKHPNARPTTEPLLRFPEFSIREFLAFENCVRLFREHYLVADATWERIPEEPQRKPESGDASVNSDAKAGDDESGDDAKQKASDDAGKPVEYRRFVKSFRWTGVIDERVASLKDRSPHAVELVMALLDPGDYREPLPPRIRLKDSNEEAVLVALRNAGFDPMNLPPLIPGKACQARQAAKKGSGLGKGKDTRFDHTWKDLSKQGLIVRKP